jgi:glycosyltransferase involved in cell wall biosynthesis
MRVLFLAPQPFYQERGTPIAIRLALEVLAASNSIEIDLLTYHEGEAIEIPNTKIHRIWAPRFLNGVGPGISAKKILCDLFFLWSALMLIVRAKDKPYALIHAVEESVFIALLFRFLFGIPYIYDMDSSLALQLTERWTALKPLQWLLSGLERIAIRYSLAVVPVCDALAQIADQHGAAQIHILRDISLLNQQEDGHRIDLRVEGNIPDDHLVALYVGNLESYQGIDLLFESIATIKTDAPTLALVIIGGRPQQIQHYQKLAGELGIEKIVSFLGMRPTWSLGAYLKQADILVSPRNQGNNTPMKIYSYLHSGRPIVATDLPTHTQVMDNSVAILAPAKPVDFGQALLSAINSTSLRSQIGEAALRYAEENYTFEVFSRRLTAIYDSVRVQLTPRSSPREVNIS